jgi:diguanylate cyclase (GGDEF)-like protein
MRWYLRSASLLAPLYGAGVAAVVAIAVTAGDMGRLAMITLFVMAAFFFMGLLLRAALATSLVILLSFAVSGSLAGMPEEHLFASAGFLLIAALLSAVIAWQTEVTSRRRFLEEALIGELIERDGLTGLKNRRAFDEHLLRLWQQSLRSGGRLAMLFFDVDYFKRYNDEYGHQAGDAVLRRIAQTAKEFARRPFDFAARFGGEEFAVVLYDVEERFVVDLAERLRSAVERLGILHEKSDCAAVVTISIGVGIVQPVIGRTPQGLLQLCDQALYKAKAEGRNRCVIEGKAEYDDLVTGAYRNAEVRKLRG